MLKQFIRSHPIRRLATFGVALPMGIILICNALRRRRGDQDPIMWITIAAGFWWIAGMMATGVALIRVAIRRDARRQDNHSRCHYPGINARDPEVFDLGKLRDSYISIGIEIFRSVPTVAWQCTRRRFRSGVES